MKTLFICHIFEGKEWNDSAAKQEVVEPAIKSGLIEESKTLVFCNNIEDFDLLISNRVTELHKQLKEQPILVYGAGAHTRKYIQHLKKLNIVGIVDRQDYLWGKDFLGYPVISPQELKTSEYPIVISTKAYEESLLFELKKKLKYQAEVFGLYDLKNRDKERRLEMLSEIKKCIEEFNPKLIIYAPPLPDEALNLTEVDSIKNEAHDRFKWITLWWDYDDESETSAYLDFERDSLCYSDLILDAGNYTKNDRLKENAPPYHNHQYTDKVYVGPTVCDPNLFYPRKDKSYDVAIFGSAAGNRANWIELLKKQFGPRFHHLGDSYGNQRILPMAEYAEGIANTKIFVNTQTYSYRSQCKGKVREALASGVLLLEEDNPDTRMFYPNDEGIVFFKGEEDLINKIEYFLDNEEERSRLAQIAHQWYSENYECNVWFTKIMDKLSELKNHKL